MRHRITLVAASLLLAGGMVHALAATILTVAVFDFESKDENVRGLGPKISALVNASLSADPNLITVERTELEKAMGEQELGLSGSVNAETSAKVGQLTGAKVLITGRVFKAESETIIVAKIIGTETSRVYGELVKIPANGSISDLSDSLAKKISTDLLRLGETLVAKVEPPEARVARIKKSLADKKLPVVSVKITEQHFGQPVVDPAVQTELTLILQQCGFPLADENSSTHPTIEVTGEAFSEFGMRKGNLQSCRARIEIKARTLPDGKIIFVDRQNSVGVDLAEHLAAKTALQNGAADLAERLLPKLVQ